MLALAESREEVIRTLQEDVYYKSGIWNWDQVQIHPVSGIDQWSSQSSSTNQGSLILPSGSLYNVPMVSNGLRNPCKWYYFRLSAKVSLDAQCQLLSILAEESMKLYNSTQRRNTHIICARLHAA